MVPVSLKKAIGIYRFWRDMGYVAGGVIAGVCADALGAEGAIALVAVVTAASGLWVARELPGPARAAAVAAARGSS